MKLNTPFILSRIPLLLAALLLCAPRTLASTVNIASPADGAMVSGIVTINGASSLTTTGVVSISIDGSATFNPATGRASWTYDWDTTPLANGNHTITARARTSLSDPAPGLQTNTVNVQNAVSVAFTFPLDGATLNSELTQTITGTSANATNVTVQFNNGPIEPVSGVASWNYVLEPGHIPVGTNTFTARANGTNGSATNVITVILQNTNPPTGTFSYTSSVDGVTMTGFVQVGTGYNPAQPTPLVIYLHGGGGNGSLNSGLVAQLNARGWIGIGPDGRLWNLFNQGCVWETSAAYVDSPDPDVGPGERDILDAIEWAKANYNIDPGRIYLTGFSMGGRGTYQIGLRNPDRFAAIAPMAPASDMYEIFVRRPEPPECKEGMVGGQPGTNLVVDTFYTITSGRFLIENAFNLPVRHNHGTTDGIARNIPGSGTYLHGYHMLTDTNWNGCFFFTNSFVTNFCFGHTPTLSELRARHTNGYDWTYIFTDGAHSIDPKWFTNTPVGTAGTVEGTTDPLNPAQYLGMFEFFERRTLVTNPATVVYKTYTDAHRRAYWAEIEITTPWQDVPGAIRATRHSESNRIDAELVRVNKATFDLARAGLRLAPGTNLVVTLQSLVERVFDPALAAPGETLAPTIVLKGDFTTAASVTALRDGVALPAAAVTFNSTSITVGPLASVTTTTTLELQAGIAVRLLPSAMAGSDLRLFWESAPGQQFDVQRTAALTAPIAWQTLATNWPAGTNTTTEFTHTNALTAPTGFYRVLRLP